MERWNAFRWIVTTEGMKMFGGRFHPRACDFGHVRGWKTGGLAVVCATNGLLLLFGVDSRLRPISPLLPIRALPSGLAFRNPRVPLRGAIYESTATTPNDTCRQCL